MADYADSINTNNFLYMRKVYFTNPYNEFKSIIVAKLTLNSTNFNFDLADENGDDFRIVDSVGTLRMWKAYWSKTAKQAILFFKLQNIGAGSSISLKAYWGNNYITANSEPEKMGFLFYEDFNSSSLDTNKWEGEINNGISNYGYLISYWGSFNTITNPLLGKNSWVMEAGLYCNWPAVGGTWTSWLSAVGFGFLGTENDFWVRFMHYTGLKHNAITAGGGSTTTVTQTNGGLEGYSQNDVYISYYEPNDSVIIKLQNRNNYVDIDAVAYRKVEGDTRPNNIIIYPREDAWQQGDGAYPTYINWFVVREYDGQSLGNLDTRDLYIPHEIIPHQAQDYREYDIDITSVNYKHESSFGGDPYKLSNEGYDDEFNVWISDLGATSEDSISLTIHMFLPSEQRVDRSYKHYDSGHVYYYNSSKLSDQDTNFMGRDFFHCTTSSGWAAIRFPNARRIGAFRVKMTEDLAAAPKDYKFYGSDYYPGTTLYNAKKIDEGTFIDISDWQYKKIINNRSYRYYILDMQNTYAGDNIKLQEWEMYDDTGRFERFYPSQLRLCPATFGNYQYNFPKEIMFEATIDGTTWTVLIPWTHTYTPFVEHFNGYDYWQRYSFINQKGFWSFRLNCRGNWGASDSRIIIGEWSIHELVEETNIYRILSGSTNNTKQIWAKEGTTLDDSHKIFYVANDKLTLISNNIKKQSIDLPVDYNDFNVI